MNVQRVTSVSTIVVTLTAVTAATVSQDMNCTIDFIVEGKIRIEVNIVLIIQEISTK